MESPVPQIPPAIPWLRLVPMVVACAVFSGLVLWNVANAVRERPGPLIAWNPTTIVVASEKMAGSPKIVKPLQKVVKPPQKLAARAPRAVCPVKAPSGADEPLVVILPVAVPSPAAKSAEVPVKAARAESTARAVRTPAESASTVASTATLAPRSVAPSLHTPLIEVAEANALQKAARVRAVLKIKVPEVDASEVAIALQDQGNDQASEGAAVGVAAPGPAEGGFPRVPFTQSAPGVDGY